MHRIVASSMLVILFLTPSEALRRVKGEVLIVLPPRAPRSDEIAKELHARWKHAVAFAENDELRVPYLGILALRKDSEPQIELAEDWRDGLKKAAIVLELQDLQVNFVARSGKLPFPAKIMPGSIVPAGTKVAWKDWNTRVQYMLWHCPKAARPHKIVTGTINTSSSEKSGNPAFGLMTILQSSELKELLAAIDRIELELREKLGQQIVVGNYLPAHGVVFGKYNAGGFAPRKVARDGDNLVFFFRLRNSLPVAVRGGLSIAAMPFRGGEQDATAQFELVPEAEHELRVSMPHPKLYWGDPSKRIRGEIIEFQLVAPGP